MEVPAVGFKGLLRVNGPAAQSGLWRRRGALAAVASALCSLSLLSGQAPEPANRVQPVAVASTAVIQFNNVAASEVSAPPGENRRAALPNRVFPEPAASPAPPRAGSSAAIGGMNGGPAPQVAASFPGAIGSDVSDGQGAVGPEHLVIARNAGLAIQSRDGQPVSSVSVGAFWHAVGAESSGAAHDSRIVYDSVGNRWITVAVNGNLLVGASETSDPTGGWYLERIDAEAGYELDFPAVAFTRDWVAVMVNVWEATTQQFVEARLYLFTKAELYANRPSAPRKFVTSYEIPARSYDADATKLYLMDYSGGVARVSAITGPVGAESLQADYGVFASGTNAGPAEAAGGLPQMGTSQTIMNRSAVGDCLYRNQALWCASPVSVTEGSRTRQSIEWVQLDPETGTYYQIGRVDDATGTVWYAYPSIAVSRNNDVLLGYSSFSGSRYPSADMAFRYASDPAGVLRSDVVVKNGEAPYVGAGSPNRGGRSAAAVDPTDDRSLWTLQGYGELPAEGESRYGLWWAEVSSPAVGLTVATSHSGSFVRGQMGVYAVTVSNGTAAGGTNGTVTVTESLPAGFTMASMAGSGWSCSTGTANVCTRGDRLGAGTSYPPIAMTVNVAPTAPALVTNEVSVSGGGTAALAKALDPTAVVTPSTCDINGDGFTNVLDVQLEIEEDLTYLPATNTLNGGSTVNVADVQIVISAALGLGCSATLPLTIPSTTLPGGVVGTAYSATVTASGGTAPYNWSGTTGLPAGLTINATSGQISGTPTAPGTFTVNLQVTDSSNPQQTATSSPNPTIAITPAGQGPYITVQSVTVGQNLEKAININFIPALPSSSTVTITSSDPTLMLVGNAGSVGTGSLVTTEPANTSGIGIYVQALGSVGSAPTVTVTVVGYTSGVGTVTIGNSGFVIAGPNTGPNTGGIGEGFSTYLGVTSILTISSASLDSKGEFLEYEDLQPGYPTVNIPVSSSNTSVGTVSSPVQFSGGSSSATVNFVAASATTGPTTVSIGSVSGFGTAFAGDSLTITVGAINLSAFIPSGASSPSTVTIGNNLQTGVYVSLSSAATNAVLVTITSDSSTLLFTTTPTGGNTTSTGAANKSGGAVQTLYFNIPAGYTSTPTFYAHAYGSSGTVGYSISATGFTTVTSTVTLAPSGLVIQSPFGTDANFSMPIDTTATLVINTAYFSGVSPIARQAVAYGQSISASVAAANQNLGTINGSPVIIATGSGTDSSTAATFTANTSTGGTSITASASASGYSSASVNVTVNLQSLLLYDDGNGYIGQGLEANGTVEVPGGTSSAVPIVLTSNSPSVLLSTDNKSWAQSINVTVAANTSIATFFIESLLSSGQGTITATTTASYAGNTDTITMVPSAILIYSATGGSSLTTSLSSGPAPFTIFSTQLDSSDNYNYLQSASQHVASNVTVTFQNTNSAVGTFTTSLTILAGTATNTNGAFTPLAAGSTTISVIQPTGFSQANIETSVAVTVKQ